jgi:hypothetical protein
MIRLSKSTQALHRHEIHDLHNSGLVLVEILDGSGTPYFKNLYIEMLFQ